MRAVVIREPGGPEVLVAGEADLAGPGPGEVRVQVAAAGVNRADLLQRRGRYPAPPGVPADVPGLEYAGTVEALGPGVAHRRVGDRVMGIVGGGAYAEAVVVHEDETLPVPEEMTLEEAAALPEAVLTADDALFTLGGLVADERLLVHAIGSGVGLAALQLGRAAGATVIGTSRTPDKLERARELGLDAGIHVENAVFAGAVRGATDGAGVDLVLELVGGPYLAEDLEAVAPQGRVVLVGLLAGARADLDLGRVLRTRITLVGTVMRSRSRDEKIAVVRAAASRLLPWLEDGRVRPVIDRILPMAEAAEAHRLMETNRNFGKLVLSWG